MDSLQETVFRFAHDVGNPLMIAMTLTDILKDDAGLTPAQRADLLKVHEAARDIYKQVKALRDRASADPATASSE